jgi:hypothetical protein
MRSTPRATPTVVLVLAALAVAIGTALWVSRARGPSWIDAIAERIEGRGRVVVLGDGSLVEEVRGGLGPVETVALDRFAGVLDGTDEAALVEVMEREGVGAVLVAHGPAPREESPVRPLRERLASFEPFERLACLYLAPEAALYVPRTGLDLPPILSEAVAHVARAILANATVPRVQSFPEPLRRIHNVEVMVLLADQDRPRLWRSARGSSFARALLTAATVARQRWTERETAMGGPLPRVLPTLDVSVHVLEEDGTLGSRAHPFIESAFRPGHGVAFEHRGNWHYLLPDATRERGGGSAVEAYAALLADQDMPRESLDRSDLRLYRSVARRVATSPAPSRTALAPPSMAHDPDSLVIDALSSP